MHFVLKSVLIAINIQWWTQLMEKVASIAANPLSKKLTLLTLNH